MVISTALHHQLELQPLLTAVLAPIENRWDRVRPCRRRLNICSLSAIIICHFHLDLQRNAHPNANTSQRLPTISLGSFRAETAADDMIVTPDPDMSPETTGDEVELDEISQSRPQSAEMTPRPSIGESCTSENGTGWSDGVFKGSDLKHSHRDWRRLVSRHLYFIRFRIPGIPCRYFVAQPAAWSDSHRSRYPP